MQIEIVILLHQQTGMRTEVLVQCSISIPGYVLHLQSLVCIILISLDHIILICTLHF